MKNPRDSISADSDTPSAIRTVTLLPEVDTYVDPASPTTSFAGQSLVISAEKNKPQKVVYVRFDLRPIPATATITACQFYFTVDGEVRKQVVRLLLVDNDTWMESITFDSAPKPTTTAVGTWMAESTPRVTTIAVNPILVGAVQEKLSAGTNPKLSVQISSAFGHGGAAISNIYFSFKQANEKKDYASGPRLVVQYKTEKKPLARDWGQYQADAQHSGRSPWVFANTPTPSYLPDTVVSGIQLSSSAVIRNERLYLFTPTTLQVLDPDGGVLRPIASRLAEFVSLALGPNGLLYAAAKSELAAFDLDGGGMKSISMPLTNLSSQITAGADGSVYLTQASTLFAYVQWGRKLIPAWSKELGTDTVSPVTLSADGSVAYIAAADKLHALYTADGSKKWSFRLPSNASHLATPVAGIASNLSCFAVDDKLYVFKDSKHPIVPELGTGLLSQPVIDRNDTLYVVQGTKLYSVGPDASVRSPLTIPGITATKPVQPVMDGTGNLFIIDNQNKLFIYKPNLEPPAGFSPQVLPFGGSLGVLQVAPNGSLFCNSASALFRLKPGVGSIVEVSSYSDATSYRAASSLVLDGSALPAAASVVFQSGGTIAIAPGFSVPVGTEVVLRTGS
jgi:outer membrane protein assembly factor BamB